MATSEAVPGGDEALATSHRQPDSDPLEVCGLGQLQVRPAQPRLGVRAVGVLATHQCVSEHGLGRFVRAPQPPVPVALQHHSVGRFEPCVAQRPRQLLAAAQAHEHVVGDADFMERRPRPRLRRPQVARATVLHEDSIRRSQREDQRLVSEPSRTASPGSTRRRASRSKVRSPWTPWSGSFAEITRMLAQRATGST